MLSFKKQIFFHEEPPSISLNKAFFFFFRLYHCLFSVPPLNVSVASLCYLCTAKDDRILSHSEFCGKKETQDERIGGKKHKVQKSVGLKIVQREHRKQTAHLKILLRHTNFKRFISFYTLPSMVCTHRKA